MINSNIVSKYQLIFLNTGGSFYFSILHASNVRCGLINKTIQEWANWIFVISLILLLIIVIYDYFKDKKEYHEIKKARWALFLFYLFSFIVLTQC